MAKDVIKQILEIAQNIYGKILHKKQPEVETPLRALSNVK